MRIKEFSSLAAAAVTGQQVCYLAAKEGARVAVADVDLDKAQATAEELRRTNGVAFPYQLDVTEPPGVTAFVDAAAQARWPAGRAG